jgi:hypothetical protein
MKQWRHQLGVPCSPTSRAVSAGMLWVATNCCCSLTALMKPNAWEPKPISPRIASSTKLSPVAPATRRRSRAPCGASIKNGSASPAVTLIATPATSAAAPARKRGFAPAVSSSAAPSASNSSVSLWAPPTASSSSTGFRPTKAAVKRGELPCLADARVTSAIAARLVASARAFNVHNPPASPSGAIA